MRGRALPDKEDEFWCEEYTEIAHDPGVTRRMHSACRTRAVHATALLSLRQTAPWSVAGAWANVYRYEKPSPLNSVCSRSAQFVGARVTRRLSECNFRLSSVVLIDRHDRIHHRIHGHDPGDERHHRIDFRQLSKCEYNSHR